MKPAAVTSHGISFLHLPQKCIGADGRRRMVDFVRIWFALLIVALLSTLAEAQAGEWTWMGGPNSLPCFDCGFAGKYGGKGSASVSNLPGGRSGSATWTDASGNLWLFGGGGLDVTGAGWGLLNDLWKFDASTGEWTWVAGNQSTGNGMGTGGLAGIYGSLGTFSATNAPGGRDNAVTWRDLNGNFWLFGGWGYDSADQEGKLNDLWEFDPSKSQWAWMGGSNSVGPSGAGGQAGQYGQLGTAAPQNVPGGRSDADGWIDPDGDLWLFGGQGYDSQGLLGFLNDLWEYNPSVGEWTWVAGSDAVPATGSEPSGYNGQFGVYGTLGVPAPGNSPGGRIDAVSWTDANGRLWLSGGGGFDTVGDASLDDLWMFNPAIRQWTWMGGSDKNGSGLPGVYGAQGMPGPANIPGGRGGSSWWTDSGGNFWLFGGSGLDSTGAFGELNDLWETNPNSIEWLWIGGSSVMGPGTNSNPYGHGNYGTLGTPAAGNTPSGRDGGAAWTDAQGNLWLFGGWGVDGYGTWGWLNDLWKFTPATVTWPAATPAFSLDSMTYSSPQQLSILDANPGASIYYTTDGSAPTTSSTKYSGPITISASETVEAIATAAGYANSPIATGTFEIGGNPSTPTPTFSPAPGSFPGPINVQISDASSHATIYYTIDGTSPSTSSTVYSGPISVSSTETIKAMATLKGEANSAIASAQYVLPPQAATPTFTPPGGVYAFDQSVTISDTMPGATIYYTTDGTTPTTSSTVYTHPIDAAPLPATGPLDAPRSGTIEAMATASGYYKSAVASALYFINPSPPVLPLLTPTSGTFVASVDVTVFEATSGAFLYYTVDGSIPTSASTLYTGPIHVTKTETINAIAIGTSTSPMASGTYQIVEPTFGLSSSPSALAISSGEKGSVTLTVTPQNGFNAEVSFACSGLPAGTSCTFSPTAVTPTGNAISTTLTIAAAATVAETPARLPALPMLALVGLLGAVGWKWRAKLGKWIVIALAVGATAWISACGGEKPAPPPVTPTQATITVTATSGTLQQTTLIAFTLN